MKKIFFIFLLLISSISAYAQVNDWENLLVLERNKEAAHSTLMPFDDVDSAISLAREQSPYYRSLNGKWKFNWVRKPADRPRAFHQDSFDLSGWKENDVPGSWELQG
jgi:beta-galactosidase